MGRNCENRGNGCILTSEILRKYSDTPNLEGEKKRLSLRQVQALLFRSTILFTVGENLNSSANKRFSSRLIPVDILQSH